MIKTTFQEKTELLHNLVELYHFFFWINCLLKMVPEHEYSSQSNSEHELFIKMKISKERKQTSGAIQYSVPLKDFTSFNLVAWEDKQPEILCYIIQHLETMEIVALLKKTTFANPKSAIFTDLFTPTNILAHLISLENERENISLRTKKMYN